MCARSIFDTILRPVFFMHNWEMMREPILGGTLAQPLDPDKPFQHVVVEDVGAFATIAFEHPDEWIGREVDIAGGRTDHARDS